MAKPQWLDWFGRSSVALPSAGGTPLDGVLGCLATLASGQNPDGTSFNGIAIGGTANAPGFVSGSLVVQSLNNASGTGRGTALFNTGFFNAAANNLCRSNHTMVVVSGAGVATGTVQFQGTLDNVNWFNLGTAVSTTTPSTVFPPVVVPNQPIMGIAANITAGITGGTISAWVASSG